ncbi:LytR C-terminal domain-containing protein [Actinoplanes sp. NPDC049265]|uniref:LytR C-terminal domain-containing protein n=1 Tax=Actinoplanes sp. NPDC049265 TaxID=3363902 RepID=UPI00370FA95B
MSFARVRAFVVLGVLGVAAVVFVVVALVRDTQGGASADGGCPEGAPLANITLPDDTDEVKIRVLNGTKTAGLADRVSDDFKNRGFQVQPPRESKTKFPRVAILQYGPKAVGNAQLINAYFLGRAKTEYSAKRTNDVIDIIIGDQYRQLATSTEVNQSLVELSEPDLPPGACPAPPPEKKKEEDDK